MFAPCVSVLGCLCLASSKLLGAYPTQSKRLIVDLQLLGWQSLSSFLVHRIVRVVCLCLVLMITHGWLPCKLSLLPYLYPSRFFHQRFLAKSLLPSDSTATRVSPCSHSRTRAGVPHRQESRSSSGRLPVVSLRSRLWISSYGASADDDSACCSPKANPSSFSNSAMFSSVHPSSPLLEDLGRE